MTCFPAPIANRSSVALGESEIIRFGVFEPVACTAGDVAKANPMITKLAAGMAYRYLNIKKLPQTLREEAWA